MKFVRAFVLLAAVATAAGLAPFSAAPVAAQSAPVVTGVAVTSDAGADATYALGETIRMTVTFSEAVTVTGTPRLKLDLGAGAGRWADYADGSGTAELEFAWTVAQADASSAGVAVLTNTLALNGGAIRSVASSMDAALSHAGLAPDPSHKVDGAPDTTPPDTTPPRLSATAVAGTKLTLSFDEAIDAAAPPASGAFTVKRTPPGSSEQSMRLSGTPAIEGAHVTLTLAEAVRGADTDVKVSYRKSGSDTGNRLRDAAGNEVAAFSDEPVTNVDADTTPPELLRGKIDGGTVTLQFSEPLDPDSVGGQFLVQVHYKGGNSYTTRKFYATGDVDISGSTVTVGLGLGDPPSTISKSRAITGGIHNVASYYPSLDPAAKVLRDLAGNPVSTPNVSYDGRRRTRLIPLDNVTGPVATAVAVVSDTDSDNTYELGETVRVAVTFIEAVNVTGTPRVKIDLSSGAGDEKWADYASGTGKKELEFAYRVAQGDASSAGVAVLANTLELNGGTIRSVANSKDAALLHDGLDHDPKHRVDARPPTLSVASVDGTALTLTFNGALGAAASLANGAFTVKKTPQGGSEQTVSLSGSPAISGATVTLTLANAVLETDTVKVSYARPTSGTGNRLRDEIGNEVASFSDEPVTNGSRSPRVERAQIDGLSLTLTFDEALGAAARLANGAFTVKKTPRGGNEQTVSLSGSPSIDGATVTLTLANPALETDTGVKVSYAKPTSGTGNRLRDEAGNEVASFTAQAVTNGSRSPTLSVASVDGATLTLVFDEALGAAARLASGVFTVKKTPQGGNEQTVSLSGSPSIDGATVTLTLANRALETDSGVKVSYVRPTSGTGNRLRDEAGNEVMSFSDQAVTNGSRSPALSVANVDGATLTLVFDEALGAAARLASGAFTVKKTPQGGNEQTVSLSGSPAISGATVTLTLANPVLETDTGVKVSYAKPTTGTGNRLRDEAGNEVMSFTDQTVTNGSRLPTLSVASVDGTALTLTFNGALGAAASLATSAFTVKKTPPGGNEQTVSLSGSPSIDGATVTLTLANRALETDTGVKVSYARPTSGTGNRLRDEAGNEVASFTDQAVTNGSRSPTLSVASVDGATLTLAFDETLGAAPMLANGAFTVKKTPQGGGEQEVSLSGSPAIDGATVTLTLADAVRDTDTDVKVNYNRPTTGTGNRLRDEAGNEVVSFTDQAVGPDETGPTLVRGEIEGGTVTLYFSEPLDPNSVGGRFRVFVRLPMNVNREFTATGKVEISGNVVTVGLGEGLHVRAGVTDNHAIYIRPADPGAKVLRDLSGNPVVASNGWRRGWVATRVVILDNLTGPPSVVGVAVSSDAGGDQTYALDETIEVTLTFSEAVNVTGTPRVKIDLSSGAGDEQWADYEEGSGSETLKFAWTVAQGDASSAGVAVLANTLELNGGAIRSVANSKDAALLHDGLDHDPKHRVDAKPPTLSVASVDGTALTLTFNETLGAAASLANGAFTVRKTTQEGGNEQTVSLSGSPAISGATVTLTLANPVLETDTDVKVSYAWPTSGTGNRLRDEIGNEVASFSDEPVTNGSRSPRVERAQIDGLSLTLTFDEALGAAARLANGAFTVKKTLQGGNEQTVSLSGSPSIDGATVTLTLANPALETDTGVKVSYAKPTSGTGNRLRDEAGNEVASFTAQAVTNGSRSPTLSVASVDGTALTLTFNGALGAAASLATSAFTVKKTPQGGNEQTVSLSGSPSIDGATATLTLANPALETDAGVKVSYAKPTSGTGNRLRDEAGNEVMSFSDQAVTNGSRSPTLSVASVDGATLTLVFDEALGAAARLASGAFTVKKTPQGGNEQTVSLSGSPAISGATVTLTLANPALETDTGVKVSYAKPTSGTGNRLRDEAGNEVASFTDQAVTNGSRSPTLSVASVDGATLKLAFDETLGAAPMLANGAFTVKKTPQGGGEQEVSLSGSPAIDGATVTLTLANAVLETDTGVKVSYARPTSGTDNRLRDEAGNEVASFSDQAVANVSGDTTPPRLVRGEIDGGTMTLYFSEPLDPNSVGGRFRVFVRLPMNVNREFTATGRVEISGNVVTVGLGEGLHVRAGVTDNHAIYIRPADPGAKVLRDLSGNPVVASNGWRRGWVATRVVILDNLTGPPSVVGVAVSSDAGGDQTYALDETIEVTLTFSEAVNVTGTPRVKIDLSSGAGDEQRADYEEGSGSETLKFAWTVAQGDASSAGVAVLANTLELNGGAIRSVAKSKEAALPHAGLAHDPAHMVDWQASPDSGAGGNGGAVGAGGNDGPATVSGVAVTSDAGADATYARGETIRVTVTFSEAVAVDTTGGTPGLAIDMDPADWGRKQASYESGGGTAALVFAHKVVKPNLSTRGIAVLADTLALNGGSIRSAATGADAALGHAGLAHAASHKVDWRLATDSGPPHDSTPPRLLRGEIDGATMTLTFSEALDPDATGGEFLMGIQTSQTQSLGCYATGEVAVDGATVTVGMGKYCPPARAGLTGRNKVTYFRRADGGDGSLRDLAGNLLAADGDAGIGLYVEIDLANMTGGAPRVTGVAVVSDAGADQTYGGGEEIEVVVTFDRPVDVTGTPRLKIDMDPAEWGEQWAAYERGSGTASLTFVHTVAEPNLSKQGIAVLANTLELSGGTIRAGDAGADMAHAGVAHDANHKVDWQRAAEREPLTARFVDVPATHGGVDSAFSFGLEFSEALERQLSSARLRTEALRATNATVTRTKRVVKGDNRRWTVTVRPETGAEVTVSLPATADCAAAGALCTADGRGLSNAVTATVSPAAASVTGVAVVSTPGEGDTYALGETVRVAVTFSEAVTVTGTPRLKLDLGAGAGKWAQYDESSGTNTLEFAWTVARGDASGAGVAVPADTLQLNGGGIRAAARDQAADLAHAGLAPDPSHKVDGAPDTTPPRLSATAVAGTKLTLSFDEAIDGAASPASGAFTVKRTPPGSSEQSVRLSGTPAIEGAQVTLTLAEAVRGADTDVKVSYRKSGSDTGNRLRDAAGNEVAAFSDEPVTNVDADTTPPELERGEIDGGTVTLQFSEPLDPDSVGGQFLVQVHYKGGNSYTTRKFCATGDVDISGSTVTVGLGLGDPPSTISKSRAITGGIHNVASYYPSLDPAAKVLRDLAGNPVSTPNVSYDGRRRTRLIPLDNVTGPVATAVAVVSDTDSDNTYELGETVRVAVTFIEAVNVTGTPRVKIDLSSGAGDEKWAEYEEGSGTKTLEFAWTVAQGDASSAGVAVLANTLELNGGTIRSVANSKDAALLHDGLDHDPKHRVDARPPTLSVASVDGTALTLTFNGALGAAASLANGAFTVKKTPQGGSEQTVSLSGSPAISGATVTLTLASPVLETDTAVKVSYARPTTGTDNRLRDEAGNEVTSFSDQAVTNESRSPRVERAQMDGLSLMLTFDEPLGAAASLMNGAFTVKKTPQGGGEQEESLSGSPSIDGATVTLTLANPVLGTDTDVKVSYTRPTSGTGNRLRDEAGNEVTSFPDQAVGSDETAPTLVRGEIDGGTVTLWFSEPLDPNSVGGDFRVTLQRSGGGWNSFSAKGEVAISGNTVTVGLGSDRGARTEAGLRAQMFYWRPAAPAAKALRDLAGNPVRTPDRSNGGRRTRYLELDNLTGVAPTVTGVEVWSAAGDGGVYGLGQSLRVRLTFSKAVTVTGSPVLSIDMDPAEWGEKRAAYESGSGTAALVFAYEVVEPNLSTEGIAVLANTLALNGGMIESALTAGENAALAHAGLAHDPAHMVNWQASTDSGAGGNGGAVGAGGNDGPGAVTRVAVTSEAGEDATYGFGETIRVTLAFSAAVTVTGSPVLSIDMDPAAWGEKQAAYESGSGTAALVFAYEVVEPNFSTQGIAVLADSLALNGGTIRSAADQADAALGHGGLGHDAAHKVDWRPLISVADARANEGAGAQVAFEVSLSRAFTSSEHAVTVDYATSDGTAKAGEDYTAASGTLTFAAGETAKTVDVAVLDDAVDEDEETFVLRLSNAAGGRIADGEATGTIANDDPLQKMWLSRFGRTVAGHVTEAVSDRLGAPLTGARVTVGGESVDLAQTEEGAALRQALTAVARALGASEQPASGDGTALGVLGFPTRAGAPAGDVSGRELLDGSAFHLAGEDGGGGPGLAAWGRMTFGGFDGEEGADAGRLSIEGEVTSGILGADVAWNGLLAGVAVSVIEGEGTYSQAGVDTGKIESRMTAVSPYARLKLNERISVWGLAGWGMGEMTIEQAANEKQVERVTRTDIEMRLGGLGGRGALLEADETGGVDLGLKADAFYVETKAEAISNEGGTTAVASRVRLARKAHQGDRHGVEFVVICI